MVNKVFGKKSLADYFTSKIIANMANRWLTLILGAALLQGTLTLSPVSVPEDEWEAFSRMLRDPAYRLPTTTRPRHYKVSLEPYFDTAPTGITPFTFDGSVVIYLNAQEQNINEVVIHCNDLTIQSLTIGYTVNNQFRDITAPGQTFVCDPVYDFLRIQTSEVLLQNQEYVIRSTFRGNLQTNMRGFYRSWYRDSTGLRWMGTTQFQPGYARQAFPCYDEPGFKATFDITMIRESDYSETLTNMPIRETTTLANGKLSDAFYTTPITSSYLLAFIVSHYQNAASNNDSERPFDIYARDNVGTTGQWALEVGVDLLREMETFTNYSYYGMAENLKMQQAAIPDFNSGAMENWGLLTYREAVLLYDELHSNHFYKQRVANIVCHEIVHMWFGNLVTCAWWDVLWLNEAFARFFQYFLTARVAPELGYETRFITEQVHMSMLDDSVDSAHPLTDPSLSDPDSVWAHFSTITYAKGASILRMTQHFLGPDTYQKALRYYLHENDFDVAEPIDLFRAFDRAAIDDGALSAYSGVTIASYLTSWSENAGHPMLTVIVDQSTGRMTITQARFNRNTGISNTNYVYHVPISWTRERAADFEDTKPSQVLTGQSTVIERGTTGLEWVVFNKQNTGFYRVNYDRTNWALLTRALRGPSRTLIHEYNRANIVDDAFVFARAGVLEYHRSLNILSFLEFEDSYAPWDAAITGFNFVIRRLAHDTDNLRKLQDEIIRLSEAVVSRLGFSERPGESYMDGLQRMYVMRFLCNVGHQGCVNAAVQNFQNWRQGGFVPANMRPWVYCTGLRQGDAADYDYFWNHYLSVDLANDQIIMLEAAGCTSNQASLERYLNSIVALDNSVRPQDYASALSSAVSGNEANTLMMWDWLKRNVDQTTLALGSISTPLKNIAARLLTEADIVEFETWVTVNRAIIGESAYNTGISGAAGARSNLAWSANRIPEMVQYLETGYIEEDIDDVEATTEPPATTQAATTAAPVTTTEVPGSANIAVLSIIILILTISISFLM